tara:strand:+ start:747 stop:926 length:180 start_codon:yes stop_codon:yes gene_type:complete
MKEIKDLILKIKREQSNRENELSRSQRKVAILETECELMRHFIESLEALKEQIINNKNN